MISLHPPDEEDDDDDQFSDDCGVNKMESKEELKGMVVWLHALRLCIGLCLPCSVGFSPSHILDFAVPGWSLVLHSAWNLYVFIRASKDVWLELDSEMYFSTPILKSLQTWLFSIFLRVRAS